MNSIMTMCKMINRSSRFCLKTVSIPKLQIYKMSTNAPISELQMDKDSFQDMLPSILDTLVRSPKFNEVPEVAQWTKQILEYNLQGGKKTRGLITTLAFETLEDPSKLTEKSLEIGRVVGWCVEMLQASCLVTDDLMDGSVKRRGVPCWYRLSGVGLGAFNDVILIYSSIFELLKIYCGHLPQYKLIIELFHETILYQSIGQHLDYTTANRNKNDYSLFTMERYSSIVKYKTAYWTYKMQVCLGLLLANNLDRETHSQAERICLEIGHMFQMQDDYIDVYGVEAMTGKIGTDIQEGKCSWLAVQALQQCNDNQRRVFTSCYGSSEPAHIERIKRLYDELELPKAYQIEERARYDSVINLIRQMPADMCAGASDLFLKVLDITYNRKK